jgi:hypothetical protein
MVNPITDHKNMDPRCVQFVTSCNERIEIVSLCVSFHHEVFVRASIKRD